MVVGMLEWLLWLRPKCLGEAFVGCWHGNSVESFMLNMYRVLMNTDNVAIVLCCFSSAPRAMMVAK